MKNKLLIFWRGWGYSIVVALIIAMSFRSAIAEFNDVPTWSMKPTILRWTVSFDKQPGLVTWKIPFTTRHITCWGHPERGDIVVFFSPEDGKRLVKRVIGLPSDTITMSANQLLINGKAKGEI